MHVQRWCFGLIKPKPILNNTWVLDFLQQCLPHSSYHLTTEYYVNFLIYAQEKGCVEASQRNCRTNSKWGSLIAQANKTEINTFILCQTLVWSSQLKTSKAVLQGWKKVKKNINWVQEISWSPHKLFTKYYILVELMLSEIQITHKQLVILVSFNKDIVQVISHTQVAVGFVVLLT